ncbi:shikimate kinase [Balneolales bacterium ANBcel1]|nr:shikimate kinase [Balneolales bacterium ANBcel1]
MNQKSIIVLTGFMGSGKSAVGKKLAKRLGWKFRDLDQAIEDREGVPIQEIFRTQGESVFRQLEHETLQQMLVLDRLVLSLGGGALQLEPSRKLIQERAIMVYLKVPEDILLERLKRDTRRPLLRDGNGRLLDDPELRIRIRTLLSEREPAYETADVAVTVRGNWPVSQTANETLTLLRKYAPAAIAENS